MDFHGHSFELTAESLGNALRTLAGPDVNGLDIRVAFADLPPDLIDIVLAADGAIGVTVPKSFPAPDRRDYFTYRWMCAWPLVVAVRQHDPGVRGSCRLWLDDIPGGPGLAFCGNAVSHTLIPDPVFLRTRGYHSDREAIDAAWRPWRDRIDQVSWRGASTGNRQALRLTHVRDLPRVKLCLLARSLCRDDLFDVGLSEVVQIWDPADQSSIAEAGIVRERWPRDRTLLYRHSIDIDGNSCSWEGFFTKLLMGPTVIKIDSDVGFRQWYYDRLVPWKNFVPVSAGMSELLEIAEWLRAHPEQAEAIAASGRDLALSLTYEAVLHEVVPRIRDALRPLA